MPTLLRVDSSPVYDRSVSRELTAAFITQWKASHPEGRIVDRDLKATAMRPVSAEWVAAVYTPEKARTPRQQELLSLSDSLLAELEQADDYVIGVPMHNFGVPDAQTQMASFNFVEPYLRSMTLKQGWDRDTFLAPHLQAVQTHAQTWQGGHA